MVLTLHKVSSIVNLWTLKENISFTGTCIPKDLLNLIYGFLKSFEFDIFEKNIVTANSLNKYQCLTYTYSPNKYCLITHSTPLTRLINQVTIHNITFYLYFIILDEKKKTRFWIFCVNWRLVRDSNYDIVFGCISDLYKNLNHLSYFHETTLYPIYNNFSSKGLAYSTATLISSSFFNFQNEKNS